MHRQIFKVLLVIALALVAGSVVLFSRSSSPPIARGSRTSTPASSGRADYSVIESVSESSERGRPSTASDPNRPSAPAGRGSPQGRSAWSPDALAGIEEPLRSEALDYARRAMALEGEIDRYYAEAGIFDLLVQIYSDHVIPLAIRGENSSFLLVEAYAGLDQEGSQRHTAALEAAYDEKAAQGPILELTSIIFEPITFQLDRMIAEGRIKIDDETNRRTGISEGVTLNAIRGLKDIALRLRSDGGPATVEEADAPFSSDALVQALYEKELGAALGACRRTP